MRDFASEINELAFDFLDAPVIALGGSAGTANVPTENDIISTIKKKIIPLDEI